MAYTFATMPYDLKVGLLHIGDEPGGGGIKTLYSGVPEYVEEYQYFVLDLTIDQMAPLTGVDLTVEVGGDTYLLKWNGDVQAWEGEFPTYNSGIYYDEGFKLWFWNEETQDPGEQYIGKTVKITYNESDVPKIETITLVDESGVVFEPASHNEVSRATFSVSTSGYNDEDITVKVDGEIYEASVTVYDGSVQVDINDNAELAIAGAEHTVLVTYQKTSGGGITPYMTLPSTRW